MKRLIAGRLFLFLIMLIMSGPQAVANIKGVHGFGGDWQVVDVGCIANGGQLWDVYRAGNAPLEAGGSCEVTSNSYAPSSGYYTVETYVHGSDRTIATVKTSEFYIDATKTIAAQTINTNGQTVEVNIHASDDPLILCQFLVDQSGKKYALGSEWSSACSDSQPLPPTPPKPDTSCTLNNGNALNVNLGNVDRTQLPTVPGSGSMRHIQVPVDCTGGDVTVNMKINYTPIIIGANQIIKSTANGLGVSVVYDSKVLSSSDVTPVTFLEGSNSVDLAFQAVRDPTVESKDIPTGAFTASAVLVMTQQ